jgi:RNA polymerase sigma-70 factor (ECF subfamily)
MPKIFLKIKGYFTPFLPLRAETNTEQVVLDSIRNGEKAQLENLYKAHKQEFVNWVSGKYSCSNDEAKDAFQFAIITLYENLRSNRITHLDSSIKTYLFAVGKHKILEQQKSSIRFSRKLDEEIPEIEDINKWDNDLYEESLQLVEKCLDKLGEPCKSLLQLYYYHGLSMEEITERMQYKNRLTSKNLKYKCINRLRKMFYEELKKQETATI